MCGVAGIFSPKGASKLVGTGPYGSRKPVDLCRTMVRTLDHRGPDDHGVLDLLKFNAVLGHSRLSILDLAHSVQPFSRGPFHLTFNGEIFNYIELRKELEAEGAEFRTEGDTEVLFELLARRGPDGLNALNGQFAFGFLDERSGELLLARDRMGVLPLYLATDGESYAFGSEIKAVLPFFESLPDVDETALEEILLRRATPAGPTLYQGIEKLPAGCFTRIARDGQRTDHTYWKLPVSDGPRISGAEAEAELSETLRDSVRLRLRADVPVGALLSGGLDSSIICALVRRERGEGATVKTWTAGFQNAVEDETPFARTVAEYLKTDHEEVWVDPAKFSESWMKLTHFRDGPLSEPADVAVHAIAKVARQHVKVLLTGEGADELLGGYPKHRFEYEPPWLLRLPAAFRAPLCRYTERLLPASQRRPRVALRTLTARSEAERLESWFAPFTWYERRAFRKGFGQDIYPPVPPSPDRLDRILAVDCRSWLPDNLLERADRMAMAESVESRPPFLDHRLADLAFRIDSRDKVHSGRGKQILRKIAKQWIPSSILDRPKAGFPVPLAQWFREGMREFMSDLLLSPNSFTSSVFDRRPIESLVETHLSGRRDEAVGLWTLMGLELWAADRSAKPNS